LEKNVIAWLMGYVSINEKLLKDLMVFVSGSRLSCSLS